MISNQTKQVQRQSCQYLTLLKKMDLFQYPFYTHLFLPSKTILPLILLYLLSLISSFPLHLLQSLKNPQQRLKRCQAWFALEDETLRSWLGHAQSVETPIMSLVMQTCQNDLGLNLCVVPPTSRIVAISEIDLVRSYKERSKVCRC